MLVEQKERLQTAVGLINNISVHPDLSIEYFIPDVLVTKEDTDKSTPYIEFSYALDGIHMQQMPLKREYLDKSPQDLANLVTFSVEQFMEEIDSRQYGAQ